jgi:phospholipid/cholesterol/gamma-HCH transport system substrate-binding protein
MSKIVTPFKVGLLALVGTSALYFSYSEVRRDNTGGYNVYAVVDDAADLEVNSAVKIAGITVGEIKEVSVLSPEKMAQLNITPEQRQRFKIDEKLSAGVAVVNLRIDEQYKLFKDCELLDPKSGAKVLVPGATAAKTTSSLLGTYYIDISPGSGGCPTLSDGELIPNSFQAPTIEQLSTQLEKDILPEMKAIAVNLREISESVRDATASDKARAELKEMVDNMAHIVEQVDQTVEKETVVLARIMDNVDDITRDVRDITNDSKDDLRDSIENVRVITADLKDITHGSAAPGEPGNSEVVASATSAIKNIETASVKLDSTLASTDSIAEKIDTGEGTAGLLINDNQTRDTLKETIDGGGDFLSSLTRMRTIVSFTSEFHAPNDATAFTGSGFRSAIGVRLQPKPDKFYDFEIIDDTRTANTFKITRETDPNDIDPATGQPRVIGITEEQTTEDAFKITFQMGLTWRFLTFRIGLKDNTGALGLDLRPKLLREKIDLKFDLFDFASPFFALETQRNPRFRATALAPLPIRGFYLLGAIDDIFNAPELGLGDHQRTWVLGLQYRFDDADLRALLTVLPTGAIP